MSPGRRIWPAIAASLAGIAVLCALGLWQVQRLHWKERLLADLATKAKADPVELATLASRLAGGENIDFTRVRLSGRFLHDQEKLLIAAFEGGPGFIVVTPLLTSGRFVVLVDRGIIPEALLPAEKRAAGNPAGPVDFVAVVRLRPERAGVFDPDNDPSANRWYWWDVPAMLAATRLPPGTAALPFVVQQEPEGSRAFPRRQAVASGLHNNHLSYAATWFSLALVLAAVSGLYLRGQMKKSSA